MTASLALQPKTVLSGLGTEQKASVVRVNFVLARGTVACRIEKTGGSHMRCARVRHGPSSWRTRIALELRSSKRQKLRGIDSWCSPLRVWLRLFPLQKRLRIDVEDDSDLGIAV